jgi:hypothetical protein
MRKYILEVKDGGEEVQVIIVTRAFDDDEALRAAHAVADMAQWSGINDVCVTVAAPDNRAVGFVGDDGSDAYWTERQQVLAETYKPSDDSN